jgi:hypothetical protein
VDLYADRQRDHDYRRLLRHEEDHGYRGLRRVQGSRFKVQGWA